MSQWLVFDVGETLASEERWLGSWADWLGVPRGTFFAALGAIIEARRPYQEVFRQFRPGIDLDAARAARSKAGISDSFVADDLYPDALPTLAWARERGYRVGIAGNTSVATEDFVRALPFQADLIGSAARWRVSKPDPEFFRRIVAEAGSRPEEIHLFRRFHRQGRAGAAEGRAAGGPRRARSLGRRRSWLAGGAGTAPHPRAQ